MSLLDELSREESWAAFREYKSRHSHLTNREFEALDAFIAERRYLAVTDRLGEPDHGFSLPERRVINKSGTAKKRVVYSFPEDETRVLKLLTFLLFKYDGLLSPSCFSFRRQLTAKDAIGRLTALPEPGQYFTLKMDLHDYFNSMPVEGLCRVLREVITDDPPLLSFLTDLLRVGRSLSEGQVIEEARGAMAGVPLSAFFANLYLLSLDREMDALGVPYLRYSDDILVFARTAEERQALRDRIEAHIAAKGLSFNLDKLALTAPGEPWEFLGFAYREGRIDLSRVTAEKLKGKLRRKCRALYRWRVRKGVDFERAAEVVIRIFNRKFYDLEEAGEFTWSRWFFPVLTTDEGLKEIDRYFEQELRYLYSGRHYKGNYAVSYEQLKALGFRSLVHEYYRYKAAPPDSPAEQSQKP